MTSLTEEHAREKWTSGPWVIEYNNDIGPNDEGFWEWYQVGPARVDWDGRDDAEAKANAYLISAAPELYAALKALLNEMNWSKSQDSYDKAMAAAGAALARARGEQESE